MALPAVSARAVLHNGMGSAGLLDVTQDTPGALTPPGSGAQGPPLDVEGAPGSRHCLQCGFTPLAGGTPCRVDMGNVGSVPPLGKRDATFPSGKVLHLAVFSCPELARSLPNGGSVAVAMLLFQGSVTMGCLLFRRGIQTCCALLGA